MKRWTVGSAGAYLLPWFIPYSPQMLVVALASTYLAIGTALFHARPAPDAHGMRWRWAADLDVSGMYAIFAVLIALADGHAWLVAALAGVVAAVVLRYIERTNMRQTIGILAAVLALDLLVPQWPLALVMAACFGVGYWFRQRVPRWGHGAWHIWTAVGLLVAALGALGG